jgi:hypothetical protein
VGESVLQIAPNATAAYSLRSLTGGDPKVVRVRRNTDNAEQDFTASGISSGALVDFVGSGNDGFVETWYDQSGNNRPLIQTTASEQPLIVESGTFLNGVKSNQATSNDTMQNLQVSTDGTNADFGTDDWASGASSKLGAVYVGTVPSASVATSSQNSIIWGGSRGVGAFQEGGVALAVVKAGTDSWRLRNERQGLSPSSMDSRVSLNADADVVLYGTTDNREFTINVNGSGNTETESADLDVREGQALSLFGAYDGAGGSYYQRSSGGVCKECYLYAGDPVANIPALATSINSHYSIY